MSYALQRSTRLTEQNDDVIDEPSEIIDGLTTTPKSISPKFFYDERGSKLFDQICELPEYYLTRTELEIMYQYIDEMAAVIGPGASLIEFGSGASTKIRILLTSIPQLAAYVPVDISRNFLIAATDKIQRDFPSIEVLPVAADFTHPFDLPNPKVTPVKNVIYFPGSTIGNFSPEAAEGLLQVMHHEAGENGALLIGIDRQKDRATLERAYSDSAGVTAEFNLNVLRHINRKFDANFDLSRFKHRAIYNSSAGRIEMCLVSTCDQTVILGGRKFSLLAHEAIVTEHSHKYTLKGFEDMADRAVFRIHKSWSDSADIFSVQYYVRD